MYKYRRFEPRTRDSPILLTSRAHPATRRLRTGTLAGLSGPDSRREGPRPPYDLGRGAFPFRRTRGGAARPRDRRLRPGDSLSDTLPGLEAVARPATAGYEVEDELRAAGALRIAGVDEVGRGSWAGPFAVCAAVTDFSAPPQLPRPDGSPVRLTDSKLLTARHRLAFADVLPCWLISFAIGAAGPEEIDEVGLTEALRRAALRAIETLP